MADNQATNTAVADDEWEYHPPKAKPAASAADDEWEYHPPAPAPPKPTAGTFQMRKGGPTLNANKLGIQGQSREDVLDSLRSSGGGPTGTQTAREGMLGFSSGLTGMPESRHPFKDAAASAEREFREHPFDRAISSVFPTPGIKTVADLVTGLARPTKEAATGMLRSVGAINAPDTQGGLSGPEQVAHGFGEAAGQVLPLVAGGIGTKAEKIAPSRVDIRNRIFKELPSEGPELTRGGELLGKGLGGAVGGLTGGLPGALLTHYLGPTALEKIVGKPELGDIRNPGPFSEIPKTMPKPGVSKVSEGPTAQEHAAVRARQAQQIKDFDKPVVPISEGPTASEHAAVRAGQAQVNKLGERKVVPLSESPTPEPEEAGPAAEEGTIPIIGAPKPGGKGGKGGAAEAKPTGSEGTAARWTNEYVMEQAKRGDRTAIEQAARRGLPLPENARYVMGDVDIPRVVLNPKEVTRFTPEGTPIRNMTKPEMGSRKQILEPDVSHGTIPPVEPLFQTPSIKVPSGPETLHTGIHMDPVNPRIEGVLPGMEGDVARQAEGAARVKGEDLTRQANTPKDINAAAGELETKSPLFRGTAASPQDEMFAPGGQEPAATPAGEPPTAEEMRPEHVDLPKLRETFQQATAKQKEVSEQYSQGRSTLKELQDAQKATEKAMAAVDEAEGTTEQVRQLEERLAKEAERKTPERVDAARDLVFDTIQKLKSMERGGPSWSEYTEEDRPIERDWRGGEHYGGKVGSIPSGRATIPWLKNHPKWGWSKLEAAMMSGKSDLYNKVLRAADDYLQGQTPEGKEAMQRKVEQMYIPPPPPTKFVNFQKPTRLEPPAEPPAAEPPAEPAQPPSGFPKTKTFSKSQWNSFSKDRQNAEYALAKRRGQTIDINTKK